MDRISALIRGPGSFLQSWKCFPVPIKVGTPSEDEGITGSPSSGLNLSFYALISLYLHSHLQLVAVELNLSFYALLA